MSTPISATHSTDDCGRHSESPVWIGAGRRRRGSALVPEPAVIAVVAPFRRVEEGAHAVPARHRALLPSIRQGPPRLVRVALTLTGDDPPVVNRSPNRWTGTAAQGTAVARGADEWRRWVQQRSTKFYRIQPAVTRRTAPPWNEPAAVNAPTVWKPRSEPRSEPRR